MRIDDAVLDRLDRGGGNIDHDEALAEIAREGAQADDVGLELLQPRVGGTFSAVSVSSLTTPVGLDAVAGLEALDRGLHEGIVGRALAGDLVEVAGGDQPLTQRLDRLAT